MKKLFKALLMILLLFASTFSPAMAAERDVEQVRAKYLEGLHEDSGQVYLRQPSTGAPYDAGVLSEETLREALHEVNFIRYLAGLEPVQLSDELTDAAQHAAVLMAANESLSHAPERPEDMEEAFYMKGSQAAACCNLASFNWAENDLLVQAIRRFSSDDGEGNRESLGHRRWLLYPGMLYTGFGLSKDAQGGSYAAMYVMDDSREQVDYDMILWPSEGAFPAEYLTVDTPWSISPNPQRYDLQASNPRIVLSEASSGAQYTFDYLSERVGEDQYFVAGGGRYGDGPAYIFHPDLNEYNELAYGYQQNQVWTVRLEGMVYADGSEAEPLEYRVEIVSLTPIEPAAVEIVPRTLTVRAGQSAQAQAQVIPSWADDLSVTWVSEDEEIATVDEAGRITGVSAGVCGVLARSVNGRSDRIEVTVEP